MIREKPRLIAGSVRRLYASNVTMTFYQAVNAAGLVPAQIIFSDGFLEKRYQPGTVSMPSANVVKFTLVQTGNQGGSGRTLTASALTGIVAINGGGTWAGVANLALPWP